MSYTDPYDPSAEDRLRFSSRHVITATAYPNDGGSPITLDVESGTVQADESAYPRWRATLTCLMPASTDVDRLDPRETYYVQIDAGYVYDSVTQDVQHLAYLHARRRTVQLPQNRLVLDLAGDELLAEDRKATSWDPQPPQSSLADFVAFYANRTRTSGTATVASDFGSGFGASSVSGVTQLPGQNSWQMMADAANRAWAQIYVDKTGTWRIANPAALTSQSCLVLNTGGGGIITTSQAQLDRQAFHNAATVGYKWIDSTNANHLVFGNAYISSGSYAASAIGWNSYYEERNVPATQSQADATATYVLKAMSRRGDAYQMSAISAYWLVPGCTVTADLPDADQQQVLVSSVTFNFPSGQMDLKLRRPEDVTIANS